MTELTEAEIEQIVLTVSVTYIFHKPYVAISVSQ